MGNLEERKSNDKMCEELIILCANGNKSAEQYLKDIGNVSRVMDDLIDKDFEVSNEQIYKAFWSLLAGLWLNPFFMQNSGVLIGLQIGSFNAWVDSNKWDKDPDETKRIYAHVMKDFINELLGTVAFLTGGYNRMRIISEKTKEFFLEEV